MLYTIRAFENKAMDIGIPNNQRIKEFMNCLGSKARDRWSKLVKNRRSGDFNDNQWNQAKKDWISEYVKDHKAKKTILNAWTSTKDFMKPKEAEIEDHADRIETICNYIDLLPGNHPELTDMERKSLLFNTQEEASWEEASWEEVSEAEATSTPVEALEEVEVNLKNNSVNRINKIRARSSFRWFKINRFVTNVCLSTVFYQILRKL